MSQSEGNNARADRRINIPLGGPLDSSRYPGRGSRSQLQVAENVVYRRIGATSKRTGSDYYGTTVVGTPVQPFSGGVRSGFRWNRGKYAGTTNILNVQIVQSGDAFYIGNDVTGIFTALPLAAGVTIAAGSTRAWYTASFDPAINSDIAIITYGSGQPIKYDGTNPATFLSTTITNKFTGCYFWHDHVWFWGDPNYPDDLYAADLAQPESFTFTNAFGAYQIGRGDGDPFVQGVIDLGDTMYVFKSSSIYAVQGFDFVQGEYPFSVKPQFARKGTTNGKSIARLHNSAIFWTGTGFEKFEINNDVTTPIGLPIKSDVSFFALGNQSVVCAASGDFLVQGRTGQNLYNDIYMCALDGGSNTADTIAVYDDYATAAGGDGVPRWSIFKGITVGAFIQWQKGVDLKLLMIGLATEAAVVQFGKNATSDRGVAIKTRIKTIRDDGGTPDKAKQIDRAFIEVDANATTFGVEMELGGQTLFPTSTGLTLSALSDSVGTSTPPGGSVFGTAPPAAQFGTGVFSSGVSTQYQAPAATFSGKPGKARNVAFIITEASNTSLWELLSLTWHCIEESVEI